MSFFVTRPPGPVPATSRMSMPDSSAMRRATGEATPRPDNGVAVARVGAGCGWEADDPAGGGAPGVGAGADGWAARPDWARSASISTCSPGAAMTTIGVPIGTDWPSSTSQPLTTPPVYASTSTVALSVSISARISPLATASPSRLTLRMSVPAAMSKPSLGMGTSSVMGSSYCVLGIAYTHYARRYNTAFTASITSDAFGKA